MREQLCSDHARGRKARYAAKQPPRVNCPPCWEIWNSKAGDVAPVGNLKQLEEERDALARELALYRTEFDADPSWFAPPADDKEHHGTLLALFSDPHYGEIVDPRQMRDYNAYNLEVAEMRTQRYFDRTILVARHYLAGVKYDGIVFAMNGDIVSGDIHEELTENNELTTYETVEWVLPRLKAGLEKWLEEFGQVHLVSAPGNHGRRVKVPKYKGRSADNADTHVARLLAQSLEGEEGFTASIPHSIDADFEVYGYRFTMEHGEEFRGGDGQVGALGPVKRGVLRKKQQTAEEGKPFDYMLVSHFHQYVPAASQEFVMNGSIKGYDEFARGRHFKPEPAQQALAVITPEHGITVQAPVLVQKREGEGW